MASGRNDRCSDFPRQALPRGSSMGACLVRPQPPSLSLTPGYPRPPNNRSSLAPASKPGPRTAVSREPSRLGRWASFQCFAREFFVRLRERGLGLVLELPGNLRSTRPIAVMYTHGRVGEASVGDGARTSEQGHALCSLVGGVEFI